MVRNLLEPYPKISQISQNYCTVFGSLYFFYQVRHQMTDAQGLSEREIFGDQNLFGHLPQICKITHATLQFSATYFFHQVCHQITGPWTISTGRIFEDRNLLQPLSKIFIITQNFCIIFVYQLLPSGPSTDDRRPEPKYRRNFWSAKPPSTSSRNIQNYKFLQFSVNLFL